MKNNKGFTLVELIAIIILLCALTMLIYLSLSKVLERQKIKTFTETLNGIIESATIYATENHYNFTVDGTNVVYDNINDKYVISLKSNLISMNSDAQIASGWIIVNSDTTIEVKNIYNGKYCAVSGTTGDYEIKKSEC